MVTVGVKSVLPVFQSAPSRGGRSASMVEVDDGEEVSIRALAWRAILLSKYSQVPCAFQSAPSRGGR